MKKTRVTMNILFVRNREPFFFYFTISLDYSIMREVPLVVNFGGYSWVCIWFFMNVEFILNLIVIFQLIVANLHFCSQIFRVWCFVGSSRNDFLYPCIALCFQINDLVVIHHYTVIIIIRSYSQNNQPHN